MRILFTGASSFTGLWFIQALRAQDHEVVATFTRPPAIYENGTIASLRTARVADLCECVYDVSFGDSNFVALLENGQKFDVLCHHGAVVEDYRRPDFDVLGAVRKNTQGVVKVLEVLAKRGGRAVVLTGSVFEKGEGAGSEVQLSVSPYGASKAMTSDLFRFYASRVGIQLRKFVIANPFGPFEEPRFTAYLMRQWLAGEPATVRTPAYVRDNIHVGLLAAAYTGFVTSPTSGDPYLHFGPSGYVQTQGDFAERVSRQMRNRIGRACDLEFDTQTDFPEPRVRINIHPVNAHALGFSEEEAWDRIAEYYVEQRVR